MTISGAVTQVDNQDWDPRILVCAYNLSYFDLVLPMYVYIVVTERYVVLVDTLVNEETAAALVEIARPYLSHRQLLVINTHADYDHAGEISASRIGTVLILRQSSAHVSVRSGCVQRMKVNGLPSCRLRIRTHTALYTCLRLRSPSTMPYPLMASAVARAPRPM